jgi:hypothetical protein
LVALSDSKTIAEESLQPPFMTNFTAGVPAVQERWQY